MALPLRDIHVPPAPPLWPPAPGWWILAAVLAIAAGAALAWHLHRRRRLRRVEALFDDTLARAETPAQAIAAMSELLRRAARTRDPRADHLHGEAWLDWLRARLAMEDAAALDAGAPVGRLLLEGGFRGDVAPGEADAVRPVARRAWLALMAPARRTR